MLAGRLGRNLRGGEVIELCSDLGGGKTTFTRGLVRGAGSGDVVASPTFMLHKHYESPNFAIEHFDFYRLNEPGQVANALEENIADKSAVVLVEWGDSVKHVLPSRRARIVIDRTRTSEEDREISITCPKNLAYLLRGLEK